MKNCLTFFLAVAAFVEIFSQTAADMSSVQFDKAEIERQLMYLASDELAGRRTTSEGGEKAAQYIAEQFKKYGVKPVPGHDSFFQQIPFDLSSPPTSAFVRLGDSGFTQGENLLVFGGKAVDIKAQAIFAGHGWVDEEKGIDDYKGLEVKGKVVFVLPGNPTDEGRSALFKAMSVKKKIAAEKGAVGLVELFRVNFPWRFFKNYFGKERLDMVMDEASSSGGDLFYAWLQEGAPSPITAIENGEKTTVAINSSGVGSKRLHAANVVGLVEGADKKLKEEYVLLSAHYDHLGVGKQGGAAYTPQDSIFNGARDNGMGTVALLSAAKSFAKNPPKRSVILLACTGEEMGMLGSAYYAENPMAPLEKTVFNLNTDGAGYNSTEHISIIGWGRTNTNDEVESAAKSIGLQVVKDPAPEQDLYDRSDNISFARKGIPALDYAPGMPLMDEGIFKYYHQPADNPDSIDYDYLLRFCQAYTLTARLIADKAVKPAWTPGDKYEKP